MVLLDIPNVNLLSALSSPRQSLFTLLVVSLGCVLVAGRHVGNDFPSYLVNLNRVRRSMSDNQVNPEVYCIDAEPCKYARAALINNKIDYKEIDSWCTCRPDEECVFGSRDYSRKLHLYQCKSKQLIEEEEINPFGGSRYFK